MIEYVLNENVKSRLLEFVDGDEYLSDRYKILVEDGGEKDVSLLEVAADAGDAEAQLLFGKCLCEGAGIASDVARGSMYILKSAGSGHEAALVELKHVSGVMLERIAALVSEGVLDAPTASSLSGIFQKFVD